MDFETLGRKDLGVGNWFWNLENGKRSSGNVFGIGGNGSGSRFRALNCRGMGQVAVNLSSMRTKRGRLSRNDALGAPVSGPGAGLCLLNGEEFSVAASIAPASAH